MLIKKRDELCVSVSSIHRSLLSSPELPAMLEEAGFVFSLNNLHMRFPFLTPLGKKESFC
jgi:hypothetical protein